METYEEQIFPGFEGELMSSVPVSPVNQHPLPGSEKARTMTVGSGTQCLMLLDLSSPLGAFSKILLESSHWTNSEEFSYVWNRLDTRFALSAFQLTPLGRSTDGSGSLLWRSPTATEDNGGGGANGEDRLAQGHTLRLRDQVKTPTLWPTPQAHDAAKGNPERVGRFGTKHGGRNLTDEVMVPKLWRTPNERDYKGVSLEPDRLAEGHQMNLNDQVRTPKLWPTPTVPNGGWRNPEGTSITGKKPDGSKAQIDIREAAIRMGEAGSGSLNPLFVEELMGFPIDHTALKPSEIPLCPSKPTRSSKQ